MWLSELASLKGAYWSRRHKVSICIGILSYNRHVVLKKHRAGLGCQCLCSRLDDRLRELEAELNSADEPTKQILQRSTALWLGSKSLEEDKSDDENGPIGGTSKTSF